MKKIVIGSDKSGFPLKEAVKAHPLSLGMRWRTAARRIWSTASRITWWRPWSRKRSP